MFALTVNAWQELFVFATVCNLLLNASYQHKQAHIHHVKLIEMVAKEEVITVRALER